MSQEVSPYSGRQVTDYMEGDYRLHDVDGDEIGRIVEINEDFIVVERGGGFLGLGDQDNLFIPRQSIAREEGTDWYLNIDEDEIDSMGWTERPERPMYESTEYPATDQTTGYEASTDYGAETAQRQSGTRMVRYEEDLETDKVSRQVGEVSVGKRVVEDTRTVEVPVRREEIEIERHPVTADASVGVKDDEAFTSDERIKVPLMEEEVELHKVARPVEEVEINKVANQDTRRVDETIRREEFDIDKDAPGTRARDDEALR